jgi:hypothetical protein
VLRKINSGGCIIDLLFNVFYVYDSAGKPQWVVMPGGTWNAAFSAFTGPLYIPPVHHFQPTMPRDLMSVILSTQPH